MTLALTIVVFLTVVLAVFSFGAAAYAPSSVLGARLRALSGRRVQAQENPRSKSGWSRRSIPSARRSRCRRAKFRAPGHG
jgi:hypothetical protein